MKQIFIVLTSMVFMACSNKDRPTEANQINAGKPLYANDIVRVFSSETDSDSLQVTVNGQSLLTAQVYLKIVNSAGEIIFWDSFPTTELINHGGLIDPEKDKELVYEQIDEFLGSDRFVSLDDVLSSQVALTDSTKTAWKTLESDFNVICFLHPARKNSLKGIAFSKSLKKVIALQSQGAL